MIKRIGYAVQIFMLLSCLPFVVMGQQTQSQSSSLKIEQTPPKVTKTESLVWLDIFCQLFNLKFKAPGQSKVYVTHLTFMDSTTKSMMAQTEKAAMINESLVSSIQLVGIGCPNLGINHPQHHLANTDGNVNKLINIFWEVNLSKAEKIQKIINEMMVPNRIDGLILGHYLEKKETISFRLFIVSKKQKNLVSKANIFDKKPFSCTDPQNSAVKILCQSTHETIRETFKAFLEAL